MLSAAEGHEEAVRALVRFGAKVNARDGQKVSALHLAARGGHVGVVSALLEHGAKVNASDERRRMPLHECAEAGHAEAARVLLEAHAQVTSAMLLLYLLLCGAADARVGGCGGRGRGHGAVQREQEGSRRSGARAAAREGWRGRRRRRERHAVDAGIGGGDCTTPTRGHTEIVEALVGAGARVQHDVRSPRSVVARDVRCVASDAAGHACVAQSLALAAAARGGHPSVVAVLLAGGAEVEARDGEGRSSVHVAAMSGHSS
eukprot:1435867-Rhodomonas_salina.3